MANISPARFIRLRERSRLTQAEMGSILGVSGKYVGMIERGEKPVDEQSSLGLLFGIQEKSDEVSTNDRKSSPHAPDEPAPYQNVCRMIPVFGWAHAGDAEAYEQLPESWQCKVPTECRDEKAFAVSLEGDSMEPKFSDGDLLIVQPSEEAHSGCLVVARFANDGVIFRRFEVTGKTITLVPLNPRYEASRHQAEEFSWIYPVWGRWTQIWRK